MQHRGDGEFIATAHATHHAHLLDRHRSVVKVPLVAVSERSRAQQHLERDRLRGDLKPRRHDRLERGGPGVDDLGLLLAQRIERKLFLDPPVVLQQLEPLELEVAFLPFGSGSG